MRLTRPIYRLSHPPRKASRQSSMWASVVLVKSQRLSGALIVPFIPDMVARLGCPVIRLAMVSSWPTGDVGVQRAQASKVLDPVPTWSGAGVPPGSASSALQLAGLHAAVPRGVRCRSHRLAGNIGGGDPADRGSDRLRLASPDTHQRHTLAGAPHGARQRQAHPPRARLGSPRRRPLRRRPVSAWRLRCGEQRADVPLPAHAAGSRCDVAQPVPAGPVSLSPGTSAWAHRRRRRGRSPEFAAVAGVPSGAIAGRPGWRCVVIRALAGRFLACGSSSSAGSRKRSSPQYRCAIRPAADRPSWARRAWRRPIPVPPPVSTT